MGKRAKTKVWRVWSKLKARPYGLTRKSILVGVLVATVTFCSALLVAIKDAQQIGQLVLIAAALAAIIDFCNELLKDVDESEE